MIHIDFSVFILLFVAQFLEDFFFRSRAFIKIFHIYLILLVYTFFGSNKALSKRDLLNSTLGTALRGQPSTFTSRLSEPQLSINAFYLKNIGLKSIISKQKHQIYLLRKSYNLSRIKGFLPKQLRLNQNLFQKELHFQSMEKKWQTMWIQNATFQTDTDSSNLPKFYVLSMFPYPSGNGLHVGHCKGYTIGDVIARWKRMQGFNVLHPIGWDSFGLPTEQFAIKNKVHPNTITRLNIAKFTDQLIKMGYSYDWARSFKTSDPDYFKWTQWIFLQMYKRGLAYQTLRPVYWCPQLGTVLANEEIVDGKSERGGFPVELKLMKQWVLRITSYADNLIKGLDNLSEWPSSIKDMQRNWIGKIDGHEIQIKTLKGFDKRSSHSYFWAFTSKFSLINNSSFITIPLGSRLLSPENIDTYFPNLNISKIYSIFEETWDQIISCNFKSTSSTSRYESLFPDLVLPTYERGFISSSKNFTLPIYISLSFSKDTSSDAYFGFNHSDFLKTSIFVKQPLLLNATKNLASNIFSNSELLNYNNTVTFRPASSYKLNDWLFSRQRFWGEPFPIAYAQSNYSNILTIPESDLPLTLPEITAEEIYNKPSIKRHTPLSRFKNWKTRTINGTLATLETQVMPQWAGSSWYYLRFIDPHNNMKPISKSKSESWLPVNLYIGGSEHAVLHLLYARFWHKFLYDIGIVNCEEPFQRLITPGVILSSHIKHFIFTLSNGTFLDPSEIKFHSNYQDLRRSLLSSLEFKTVDNISELALVGKHLHTSLPVFIRQILDDYPDKKDTNLFQKSGQWFYKVTRNDRSNVRIITVTEKMSKSKGNIVSPDEIIKKYGSDTLRLHLLFLGPIDISTPWRSEGLESMHNFLKKVLGTSLQTYAVSSLSLGFSNQTLSAAHLGFGLTDTPPNQNQTIIKNFYIEEITKAFEKNHFNIAISLLMKFYKNMCQWPTGIPISIFKTFITLLNPLAPHLTEEIWENISKVHQYDNSTTKLLANQKWPTADQAIISLHTPSRSLVIQINGKKRFVLEWDKQFEDKNKLILAALDSYQIKRHLNLLKAKNKTYKKAIYFEDRGILNLIIN